MIRTQSWWGFDATGLDLRQVLKPESENTYDSASTSSSKHIGNKNSKEPSGKEHIFGTWQRQFYQICRRGNITSTFTRRKSARKR